MTKLVILKLDGIPAEGCRVIAEIWSDRDRFLELTGKLPPNPELADLVKTHWETYRQIGDPSHPSRIKPGTIEIDGRLYRTVQECKQSADELSDRFQKWLDSPEFLPIDRGLRDELSRDEMVRVQIRAEDSQLQKLPWHLWNWLASRQAEGVLSRSQYRRTPDRKASRPHPQVRILAILGHSEGIDIEADRQMLESLPDTEVVFLVEPTRQDLSDRLWAQSWDILFFAGHSQTEGEQGRIYLNPDDSFTLDELWYGLRQAVKHGLQLAIFNSCDGLGLAQQLGDLQIPQMVVMRELVSDKVAHDFLKYFLDAFSQGKPFELAVRQAREQLQGLEDEHPCASWLPAIVSHPQAESLTWQQLYSPPRFLLSKRQWQKALEIAAVVAVAVMGVRSLGWLQAVEQKAYDLLMQARPAETADPRLLVVEATEADVNRYGFPIPDDSLAQAIDRLQVHQPRVIALDIYRNRPNAKLLRLLQQSPNTIALCHVGQADAPNNPGIAPPPNVPESRHGFSDIWRDGDRVLRRYVLFMQSNYREACATQFSFGSLAALLYLQADGIEPITRSSDRIQLGKAILTRLPKDASAYRDLDNRGFQLMLNYRNAAEVAQRVRLADVLEGKVDPNLIKNRIVLIGVTAPVSNASGFFVTPLTRWGKPSGEMSGVMVEAHAISQLLSAVLDDRPLLAVWNPWIEGLWVGGWAVLGGAIALSSRRRIWVWGLAMGISAGGLVWVSLGLLVGGQWVPLVPAAGALFAAGAIGRSVSRQKQRRSGVV